MMICIILGSAKSPPPRSILFHIESFEWGGPNGSSTYFTVQNTVQRKAQCSVKHFINLTVVNSLFNS